MTPMAMTICYLGMLATLSGLLAFFTGIVQGKSARPVLWALATAGLLGTAALASWLAAAETSLTISLGAVALVWTVFATLRLGTLVWTARMLAQPRVQAALLLTIGLGLAVCGLRTLETNLEDDLSNSDFQLELMVGSIELVPVTDESPMTDAGRAIPLYRPNLSSEPDSMENYENEFLERRHLNHLLIQTGPLDVNYNCHGWVFTGGKFWVRGAAVPDILEDNGYQIVKEPRAGDLAIFTGNAGEVTHTALVRGRGAKGLILLESKWGKMGRFIHTADKHLYVDNTVQYYRTERGSHVLDGMPDPESIAGEVAE